LVDDPAEGRLVSAAETVKTSAEYSVDHFCPLISGFDTGRRDRKPVAAQVTFFSLSPQVTALFQLLDQKSDARFGQRKRAGDIGRERVGFNRTQNEQARARAPMVQA
jgi:hypothetical protein